MNEARLAQLFDFLKEDPKDPFLLYAIATEYRASDINKALEYYELLLRDHPDYVGTYYHAGKAYEELNRKDDAEAAYKKGMQVARQQGQMHAFAELQGANNKLLGLDYEDED